MEFELQGQAGRARRGSTAVRAWRGRHPGVHARGHLWHGEKACCREILKKLVRRLSWVIPSICGCDRGTDIIREHGDLHDFHAVAGTYFDGLRRVSGI